MRYLCFILLLSALFILVISEDCGDIICPDEFDIHCATDGTCYYQALSACAAQQQSCYRERMGLPGFYNIHRGYCNWGLPRCKTYRN